MKSEFTVEYKRSWWTESKKVDVAGSTFDAAIDRFWVWMWKNSRDKRGSVDIISVTFIGKVVV